MKTAIATFAAAFVGSLAAAEPKKPANSPNVWPMFHRTDVVNLEGVEIPKAYMRTKITDANGRTIEGEWLEINRANKTIKFRRALDGKEFPIPFANLSETDRRYAELENGMIWDTGEKPLEPLNLIIQGDHPRSPMNIAPNTRFLRNNGKVEKAELIGQDTVRITVSAGDIDPFVPAGEAARVTDFPLAMLTDHDRALIKEHTGIQVPVMPRPPWTIENEEYWKSREVTRKTAAGGEIWSPLVYPVERQYNATGLPAIGKNTLTLKDGKVIHGYWIDVQRGWQITIKADDGSTQKVPIDSISDEDRRIADWLINKSRQRIYKFDPTEPRISDEGLIRPKTLFDLAFNQFLETYTNEEILDHLRARTLTSAFLRGYDDHWRGDYFRGAHCYTNPKPRLEWSMLEKSIATLPKNEPDEESVSLHHNITSLGIKLFEETTPNSLSGKDLEKTNELPIDGELQAWHFVGNYLNLSRDKPKQSLANLLSNIEPRLITATSGDGASPARYLSFDTNKILQAIEKTHDIRLWSRYGLAIDSRNERQIDFDDFLAHQHLRQQIRNGKLSVVYPSDQGKAGYYILTGFVLKPHEETTYEAIAIDGPNSIDQPRTEYEVSQKAGIRESEIRLPNYFLD